MSLESSRFFIFGDEGPIFFCELIQDKIRARRPFVFFNEEKKSWYLISNDCQISVSPQSEIDKSQIYDVDDDRINFLSFNVNYWDGVTCKGNYSFMSDALSFNINIDSYSQWRIRRILREDIFDV